MVLTSLVWLVYLTSFSGPDLSRVTGVLNILQWSWPLSREVRTTEGFSVHQSHERGWCTEGSLSTPVHERLVRTTEGFSRYWPVTRERLVTTEGSFNGTDQSHERLVRTWRILQGTDQSHERLVRTWRILKYNSHTREVYRTIEGC